MYFVYRHGRIRAKVGLELELSIRVALIKVAIGMKIKIGWFQEV